MVMNIRNLLSETIPAGVKVMWAGDPEPPTPKHERCFTSYDKESNTAVASWEIPTAAATPQSSPQPPA